MGQQLVLQLSLPPPVADEDEDVEADVGGRRHHLVGEREDGVVGARQLLQRVGAQLEVVVLLQNYAANENQRAAQLKRHVEVVIPQYH